MSHYLLLVITPLKAAAPRKADALERPDIDAIDAIVEIVAEMLEPYEDLWKDPPPPPPEGTKWDSWIIGGRWSGFFDGYNPYEDERNLVVCPACNGNGVIAEAPETEGPENEGSQTQGQRRFGLQAARERFVDWKMDSPDHDSCY